MAAVRRAVVFGAALAVGPMASVNTGQAGCPCIEWSGLDNYLVSENGQGHLAVYPSGQGGKRYLYPSNYGTNNCQDWDLQLPPYCREENGAAKVVYPSWCTSAWCYVSKDNCNLPMIYRSSYFPNDVVHYSYSTCGAQNTFVQWFGSGAATSLHNISELIGVVEGYTKSTRDEIERALINQTDNTTGCSLTSGCSCASCQTNAAWSEDVTFTDTTAIGPSNPKFQCLGMIISETYKRVAGREYNDASRIGYMYFGLQEDGSYMQWPAVSWCPSSYDPRYRDWYAGPAAGPKDVVLVIDRSGSMSSSGRLSLAIQAARAVLDTLTWVDFVSIIAFNSDVAQATETLWPATLAHRNYLKTWLQGLWADGGTNFIGSLRAGMNMLRDHRGDKCATSTCGGALLFLTDGQPSAWSDSEYGNIQARNTDNYVRIFSYALGANANFVIPQRLASENGGQFQYVPDNGNLKNAMADYYRVFAGTQAESVRWVLYQDLITNDELLAGCLPVYNRKVQPPTLLGVTCMDLNVIADLATLRATAGWPQFQTIMEANSRKCSNETGRTLSAQCADRWNEYLAGGARPATSASILAAVAVLLAAVLPAIEETRPSGTRA